MAASVRARRSSDSSAPTAASRRPRDRRESASWLLRVKWIPPMPCDRSSQMVRIRADDHSPS